MPKMTSRERLLRSIRHEEPDRIPLDLGGVSTGIETLPFDDLKKYLGKNWKTKNFMRDHVEPPEELLRLFGIDTRYIRIKPPGNFSININPDNSYLDEWGTKWMKPDTSLYWDPVDHPLKEARIEDLESYPWPDPDDPGRYAGLKQEAKNLHENSEYAIVGDIPVFGAMDYACLFLMGPERFYMDVILNQEFILRLFEILTDLQIRFYENYLSAIGKYIDVIMVAEDLGGNSGPLISPDHYRKLLKPYAAKLWKFVKENTDAYLFLHCCGSVYKLIPDLIEIGVDPVQVGAEGMAPKRLKAEFGDKLTFWGAIDTQRVMPFGSPEDVDDEVRTRINELAPGGGYVLTAVHNIQAGVKPENVCKMYEAARKYGTYPIKETDHNV